MTHSLPHLHSERTQRSLGGAIVLLCVLGAGCARSRTAYESTAGNAPSSLPGPSANQPGAGPAGQGGTGNPTPQAPPPTPVPPADVARGWQHPRSLSDNISFNDNDADSGALGMSRNGDAMIAWEYGSRIYASERRSSIWRHPIRGVSQPFNPAGGSMFDIDIDMDPRGDTVMVWVQKDGLIERVYKSDYHSGVWTNPVNHADHISPPGGGATHSQVAMEDNGDAIVVWEQYGSTGARIYKSELRAGIWTHPIDDNAHISPDVSHSQDVAVAIGANGHAIVVWAQADYRYYRIYKSERRAGIWTHPATLADCFSPDGTNAYEPSVAFDGSGNAVIAWLQGDGTNQQVFKAEFRAGAWTYPTSRTDNISPDGTAATRVRVAMSSNGRGIIVWRQATNATDSRLFKSEYRGSTWRHPATLATHFGVGPTVDEFAVQMDALGETVIAYTAKDATQPFAMYLSEFRGGAWQHATSLTEHISPTGPDTSLPRVSIDGGNDVVVLWRQSTGANGHAFISEYRAY